jgi:tRNA threonylcarbamoyl adenosine modification protein (Sua5/YciO/YrdC/YwlC family)
MKWSNGSTQNRKPINHEDPALRMNKIVQIDADRPAPEIIRRACALLQAGELVGVPTETVYGIACDPAHLEKIYAAKERDRGKPVARLAASLEQVEALGANFGKDGRKLAEKYWPGPLTLVLETPEGTTGFRVPDHPVPLALARAFGKPIALTSANKSGGTDAMNAQEAFQCFQALEPTASDFRALPPSDDNRFQTLENPVSLYLESFQPLENPAGKPSTVVQCLPVLSGVEGENGFKILREGAVSKEEIEGEDVRLK